MLINLLDISLSFSFCVFFLPSFFVVVHMCVVCVSVCCLRDYTFFRVIFFCSLLSGLCSTSAAGGSQVDGLPPASSNDDENKFS